MQRMHQGDHQQYECGKNAPSAMQSVHAERDRSGRSGGQSGGRSGCTSLVVFRFQRCANERERHGRRVCGHISPLFPVASAARRACPEERPNFLICPQVSQSTDS